LVDKKVSVVKQELVHDGFLKINRYTLQHSLHDGGMSAPIIREVMERGHAVAVLLHDPKRDEIVLIEQFRIGAIHEEKPWLLELVAGVIEEGEKPEDVARREAEEESGAEVGEMEFIANYYCSAGGTTETTAVFYAQIDASGVSGVHGVEGENEDIRVVKVSAQVFIDSLTDTTIHTASLLVAGYWFKVKFG